VKKNWFRVGWRLGVFVSAMVVALFDFWLRVWLRGRAGSLAARTVWMQRWAGNFLTCLHVHVTHEGEPPAAGLLVANHLSYLDIPVLGVCRQMVFVSKAEVRSWPLLGPLTRYAGTLYIQRERRTEVGRLGGEITSVAQSGGVVALFPEGTSSDGREVLPFHASLLAPAAGNGWPVTPAWIHYTLADGAVSQEVCYWGDMTFGPHLLNLLSKKSIRGHVCFGPPVTEKLDRKELARRLHAEVCQLKTKFESRNLVSDGAKIGA